MLGIMTLHILGHGGILDSLNILSVNYNIAWLLETCAYCAVDCFMLISGYIGVESKFKYSNLIYLVGDGSIFCRDNAVVYGCRY